MAEVLYGSLKHNDKVFEAGTLASKLPKAVREHARNIGFLVQEESPPEPEIDNEVDEVDEEEEETGDEE